MASLWANIVTVSNHVTEDAWENIDEESRDATCEEVALYLEFLAREQSLSGEERHFLTGAQHALMGSIKCAHEARD